MRITKPGEIRHGFEGEWRCHRCGCTWEMDTNDTKPAYMSDQRDGDAWHMPCPTCKNQTYRAVPRATDYHR